jgi:hypothetical protein
MYPGVAHQPFDPILAGTSQSIFREVRRRIFVISSSRLSRRFSARNRDSSTSSRLTVLPPVAGELPSAAALTQLRKVWSLSPSFMQTLLTLSARP